MQDHYEEFQSSNTLKSGYGICMIWWVISFKNHVIKIGGGLPKDHSWSQGGEGFQGGYKTNHMILEWLHPNWGIYSEAVVLYHE